MLKTLILVMLMLIAATMMHDVNANSSDSYQYTPVPNDLTVEIKYPLDAYPNQTITVNVTIKAWTNLIVNRTVIELYTFNNLTREDELFYSIKYVSKPESLLGGESLNETSYEVKIPNYAANVLYGKIILKWTVKGTEESTVYERKPTFVMGYLRNPELERLRSEVTELEEENAELKRNLTNLNNTLTGLEEENVVLKGNVTDLNNTLTELLNNLTDLENRYEGELSGTRNVTIILAITTVFFVATTAYLFMRKPKQYW